MYDLRQQWFGLYEKCNILIVNGYQLSLVVVNVDCCYRNTWSNEGLGSVPLPMPKVDHVQVLFRAEYNRLVEISRLNLFLTDR